MLDLNTVRKVATPATENMSAALKGGGGVHQTGWVDSQAEVMGTTWGQHSQTDGQTNGSTVRNLAVTTVVSVSPPRGHDLDEA